MKRLASALLAGVLTLLLLLPGGAAAAARTHNVQYGETLTSIAAQYGVSVDTVASTNGLASPNLIYAGQTLTIPDAGTANAPAAAPSAPAAAPAAGSGYIVQPGDNLTFIAAQFGVTIDGLASANSLANDNFIYAGQRLTIPGTKATSPAKPAPPAATTVPMAPATPQATPAAQPTAAPPANPAPAAPGSYVLQPGDNLSTIAASNGVTVDALAQANGISNPNLVYAGMKLFIPVKAPASANTGGSTPQQAPPPQQAAPPPAKPAGPTPTAGPRSTPPASLPVAPTPAPNKPKVVPEAGALAKYVVQPGDVLFTIAARYNTTVDAIVARNNLASANVIYAGQTLEILTGDKVSKPGALPSPTAMPISQVVNKPGANKQPVAIDKGSAGKWIDVNLTQQRMTAYEGNTQVFTTLVSTGVAWHPTVIGTFHIYAKYLADDMSGGSGAEYYYLPAVPYTMYFYAGYALHGTYWHHNFGHPMSHGCVNLPTPAAQWVYYWAPVGTPVVTHW